MNNIPFINTNDALAEYCLSLQSKKVIALDTEFLRVRTFYPKPGLFQLNDGDNIVLIDPCAITQWDEFKAVLVNPEIIKVFHACDEDIELLHHFLGVETMPVFDTQVAAAFCGYDFCMGYQRLIKKMLDVDLEKSSSRSDWMQRPLTQKQLHYAVDDVRYLLTIYEQLKKDLEARNLLHIIEEEYGSVLSTIKNDNYENAYLRVKQAWKLNPQEFAVLKALATWREEMMREKDMPRNKIAKNDALMTLAGKAEWDIKQLYSIEGLPSSTVKTSGDELIALIDAVSKSSTSDERMPKPIKADELMDKLRAILKEFALEMGVAEQMLGKKSFNEQLYWMLKTPGLSSLPEGIQGWRRDYYEKAAVILQR